jgi:hypothetical protein
MKNLTIVCATLALVASLASTLSAAELPVSRSLLVSMGLDGVKLMSDHDGMAIRGKGMEEQIQRYLDQPAKQYPQNNNKNNNKGHEGDKNPKSHDGNNKQGDKDHKQGDKDHKQGDKDHKHDGNGQKHDGHGQKPSGGYGNHDGNKHHNHGNPHPSCPPSHHATCSTAHSMMNHVACNISARPH